MDRQELVDTIKVELASIIREALQVMFTADRIKMSPRAASESIMGQVKYLTKCLDKIKRLLKDAE